VGRGVVAAYVGTGYRVSRTSRTSGERRPAELDFYRPAQASGPLPTAFMHGGGVRVTSRKEAAAQRDAGVQMGWNAVNVEYRGSGIARAGDTSRRALRAQVSHQQREGYGVDTDRIVVTGQSAGSHWR
jgi:acetyl esterase/lipase